MGGRPGGRNSRARSPTVHGPTPGLNVVGRRRALESVLETVIAFAPKLCLRHRERHLLRTSGGEAKEVAFLCYPDLKGAENVW